MTELNTIIATMRRPRLLVRAARIGVREYRRDRDLCRILKIGTPACNDRCNRSID